MSVTVVEQLFGCIQARDWVGARACLHDDFEAIWPATAERFSDPSRYIAIQRDYPEGWTIDLRRVVAAGDVVAAEVRVPQGDDVFWLAGFYDLRDGLIVRAVEHWSNGRPSEPPAWRAPYADRLEG